MKNRVVRKDVEYSNRKNEEVNAKSVFVQSEAEYSGSEADKHRKAQLRERHC